MGKNSLLRASKPSDGAMPDVGSKIATIRHNCTPASDSIRYVLFLRSNTVQYCTISLYIISSIFNLQSICNLGLLSIYPQSPLDTPLMFLYNFYQSLKEFMPYSIGEGITSQLTEAHAHVEPAVAYSASYETSRRPRGLEREIGELNMVGRSYRVA